MPTRHLHTRFLLAGCLLGAAALAPGLWSAWTFARLRVAADDALARSQETIDLAAALAGSLEREDDALLLALGGSSRRAASELAAERLRGNQSYEQLLGHLNTDLPAGPDAAHLLRAAIDAYRAAGSDFVAQAASPQALERYHRQVNPLLRQAVAACGQVREETIEDLRRASLHSRDEAARATRVVVFAALAALLLASGVSAWLARSVVRPVRALTDGVEAVRNGDFGRRLRTTSRDELGALAEGFNRMAETLVEYRSSSLGELLIAKTTLEATLNALPDAVLVVAPGGELTMFNPLARQVLAALGAPGAKTLHELPLSADQLQAIAAALAGRPAIPARADFAHAVPAVLDGRPCRFLLRALPIPELSPGACGAVVVLDDVTELARLDELRGELIGVASHELKTPLTTVRMSLLLLGEAAEGLNPRQRELLAAALGGCEELSSTIDELLDMTRIEAGQLRLGFAPVDLVPLLEQVIRPLRPRFEDAGVRLQVLREGPTSLVRGDGARLATVLANLLTNALKYSPAGGTILSRIIAPADARAGGYLTITVTDEGPGVPAELRERIFEKFFRVEHHRGATDGQRGTGIGLYLCREIVRAHGGSIHCEAGDNGRGTRIVLSLPATAMES